MAKHIAVFGSPGSGKSVFCAALAKEILNRKKRTVIVSGDHLIPMVPFFCGDSDVWGLGRLCAGEIIPRKVAQSVRVLKKYPDIGVIGMQLVDDMTSVTGEQLIRISEVLNNMADVVLWDGVSDMDSVFDQMILTNTDLQVCLLTADMKGILYFEQHQKKIQRLNHPLLVEGLSRPYSVHEEMSYRVGGFEGSLPFGREIERICLEGKVFSVDEVCHKKYRETVEQTVEKVLAGKEG